MTRENRDDRLILLTGATGYVGGRLLRVLEHRGHRSAAWLDDLSF